MKSRIRGRRPPVAPDPALEDRYRRAIEAALPIARERGRLAGEMKEALLEGNDQAALALLRRYLGLPPVQTNP